jgi:hypothetical protein
MMRRVVTIGLRTVILMAGMLLIGGCTYYRIREPAGKQDYYTDNWSLANGWNGAIGFTDYKSGDHVVLQQHQSKIITKAEFDAAVAAGKPSASPTPGATPAGAKPMPVAPRPVPPVASKP